MRKLFGMVGLVLGLVLMFGGVFGHNVGVGLAGVVLSTLGLVAVWRAEGAK